MVRPSYVLGGRSMQIVYDEAGLLEYMRSAVKASPNHPVLIDKYLADAIEVDVDAISDGEDRGRGGNHGAYRRSRGPFRRFSLFAASVYAWISSLCAISSGKCVCWRWSWVSSGL